MLTRRWVGFALIAVGLCWLLYPFVLLPLDLYTAWASGHHWERFEVDWNAWARASAVAAALVAAGLVVFVLPRRRVGHGC